ncbi:MAG: hypothetical protein HQK79_00440 [Desulfobacterales bacterium]|nr:hypothetical protein [Desulfobacterales bacterium]MBF0395260.1 hypothetical protein [Desulfobacterales bacterium]
MGNITEFCKGCVKINAEENCTAYKDPSKLMKWVNGESKLGCSFNSAVHMKDKTQTTKERVGQQKQKKKI